MNKDLIMLFESESTPLGLGILRGKGLYNEAYTSWLEQKLSEQTAKIEPQGKTLLVILRPLVIDYLQKKKAFGEIVGQTTGGSYADNLIKNLETAKLLLTEKVCELIS